MRKHEDSIDRQHVNYEKPSVPVSTNVGLYLLSALFVGGVTYYIYKKISENNISKRECPPQTISKNDLNNRSLLCME